MRTILRVVVIALVASACGDDALVIRTVNEYNEDIAVPGVRVQVNDEPWLVTDENGEASFGVIPSPYTVRVHQSDIGLVTGAEFVDVWQLPDRSGTRQIIRVDGSFGEWREATISGTVTGRSGAPGSVVRVLGVPVGVDGTFEIQQYSWYGPSPHTVVLRVLESDDATPPTQYTGYTSRSVVVEGGLVLDNEPPGSLTGVTLDLQPVAQARVSGQVTVADAFAAANLSARLTLRFPEGLYLGMDAPSGGPAAFDYVFPDIAGAQPALAFWTSLVDVDRYWTSRETRMVALPTSGLDIVLPEPVEPIEPADGASIDGATVFRWSTIAGADRYSLSAICHAPDDSLHVNYREIETAVTQASLPVLPGLVLPSGSACWWSVGAWYPANGANQSRYETRFHRYASSVPRTATVL